MNNPPKPETRPRLSSERRFLYVSVRRIDASLQWLFAVFRSPCETTFWWWACVLILCGLFLESTLSGGLTSDEYVHFNGVSKQWEFARNVLFGPGDQTFRSIPEDWGFYGLGTSLPARVLSRVIDTIWLSQKNTFDKSFSLILHFTAFVCAVAASWYTGRLVHLATDQRGTGILAALALLVTPVWVGYGFFDYKDVPVAAGLIATVYYAAGFITDRHCRTLAFFFAALLFLGAQKLAAIPLALPACFGVAFAVAQERSARLLAMLAAQAIAFLVLLYLVTPPSWQEPVRFLLTSWRYMAQFPEGPCTFTAGQCIGHNAGDQADYSALRYLGLWYAVQLPLLLQIGLLAAIVLYIRSFRTANPPKHLIAASFIWPITVLGILNSTLYNGIRHTLFLLPLAVSLVFVNISEHFWLRCRPWLAAYGVFLLIDTVALQPYGYVWFNEWARFFANETNYETDYWGYSLREAASLAQALRGSNEWIVGYPNSLVESFVPERYATDIATIPQGSSYLFVESYSKYRRANERPPTGCKIVGQVERRQLLAPQPLHLAYIMRCGL
jgi:hypothetical protein